MRDLSPAFASRSVPAVCLILKEEWYNCHPTVCVFQLSVMTVLVRNVKENGLHAS